jgi:diguanylate cyclase (GGDEF)-like protein
VSGGAALVVQSYAPIHRSAREVQLRVGAVLETLLVVLFLVFVPLLARVTRQIAHQIDEIRYRAFYDELTGLPNRTHLLEHVRPAIRRAHVHGRKLAFLHVDLDGFHEINNTLGRDAGDAFLQAIAWRLDAAVGPETLLARLGGDVFAIVIECAGDREAVELAEHVRAAIEPPVMVDGVQLAAAGTVGVALYPNHGVDAETLAKHAEVAAYAAKNRRVGTLVYSRAVDPHDPEQLELVAELQDAAEHGQLRLHYQPKVDLVSGRIAGLEALAYWDHPRRGLLAPGAFIPIAERTGAIRHVTRAVLVAAIEQLKEWDSIDHTFTVAINLSAVDLLNATLPKDLRTLLRRNRVDPRRLCVELTERMIMAAPDQARSILERIVALGVRVSVDDFGTGHSSLAHLKNLPVHEVKIDRSFVSDMTTSPNDRRIVRAAIQLGHSLGLEIVAEGVETAEVDAALRELRCDFAQGFLYGRPQRAEVVTAMLVGQGREAA